MYPPSIKLRARVKRAQISCRFLSWGHRWSLGIFALFIYLFIFLIACRSLWQGIRAFVARLLFLLAMVQTFIHMNSLYQFSCGRSKKYLSDSTTYWYKISHMKYIHAHGTYVYAHIKFHWWVYLDNYCSISL